ncbi:MAG TPA: DeoR/GlpR transcriptional regulator [Firmicutes bacterium]|nr:DeoR/GlpR transcriptional regulator [Bacillota bacterium]
MPTLPMERRAEIIRILEAQGSVRVATLAVRFNVTEETIRRDLEALEEQGILQRTYGGAVRAGITPVESPVGRRELEHRAEKEAMAQKAVDLIEDGETLFLDSSTTALALARALRSKQRLTVLTNGVRIVMELATRSGYTVIATGGLLRESSLSFVGPLAERAVSQYHVDWAFLSCKGFTLERGMTESNELEAQLKRLMVSHAHRAVAMVDSSKFGHVAFATIVPISDLNILITDDGAPGAILDQVRESGVEVMVAKVDKANAPA